MANGKSKAFQDRIQSSPENRAPKCIYSLFPDSGKYAEDGAMQDSALVCDHVSCEVKADLLA